VSKLGGYINGGLEMTITKHFKKLGAPLVNRVWSWGAVSKHSSEIYLRVWQDEIKIIEGITCVRLTDINKFEGTGDLGYKERLDHIAKIFEGYTCYLVFCVAKETANSPRKISNYIEQEIFPTGILLRYEHDFGYNSKQEFQQNIL
jgi:hypothetical protein